MATEAAQVATEGVFEGEIAPTNEPAIFEAIGVLAQEMYTIQDRTVRPKIAYRTDSYNKADEDEVVRTVLEEKLQQHAASGQITVYRRIRGTWRTLRSKLRGL